MYLHTWNKYLPVIRLLLKKAASGEQQMSLNRIDFDNGNRNKKLSCHFSIELERGRLSPANKSVAARDLLEALMQDEASKSILRQGHYSITLTSAFLLTIKNITPAEEEQKLEEDNAG
jgi:hypothetical protein